MSEKFTYFLRGPLSQWHPSVFIVDGVTYVTAEQWMMAEKARLFGDHETEQKILDAKRPWDQKKLGREVKGFDKARWNAVARNLVYEGNRHKFLQNSSLREHLFSTCGTTLVEVNPDDDIWGIALAEGDERTFSRETWQGTNWLGEVLTRLRENLLHGHDQKLPDDTIWS